MHRLLLGLIPGLPDLAVAVTALKKFKHSELALQ